MRYKVWNGTDTIYTLGRNEKGLNIFTPEEWKEEFSYLNVPGAKCVISGKALNGGICEEYNAFLQRAIESGCPIDPEIMDDEEMMLGIELWEDAVLNARSDEPSLEERSVAAAEFANILAMDDVENELKE